MYGFIISLWFFSSVCVCWCYQFGSCYIHTFYAFRFSRVNPFELCSVCFLSAFLFFFVVFFVHINCIKRSRIERSYATKGANKICNDQKKQILKNLNVYFWQQSIFHCFFEEGTLPDTLLTSPHINFFHSLQKSIVRAAFLLPSE